VTDLAHQAASQANPQIEFVTPVRPLAFPSEWYDANSEDHFWFQWRARAAAALIERLGLPTRTALKVFDIGCGTGITCRQLAAFTSWRFDGADLNVEALRRCTAGLSRVLYYDILEKRPEFREHYDVVILFDVVEHIEDTGPFLDAVLFHLKRGGILLVNVPALMGLFGVYDTVAGHYRRYTRRTLANEFASLPASVAADAYWGLSMVPLLWLRKQMQRGQTDEAETIRSGFLPPSPLAHTLLKTAMRLETSVPGRPPVGTSVMAAIRKDD
jgi:2-polyprenyl-3-methyl-5-hydroxy-6-metoxy-1,4-benzoquinol methylase